MPKTNIEIEIDPSGSVIGARVVSKALDDVEKKAKNTGNEVDVSTKKMQAGMIALKATVVLVTAALAAAAAVAKKSSDAAKGFEATISDLSAITGATGADLKFLSDASKEFGKTTTLAASEAAEAFKLVASAKPDLLENAQALKQVTKEAITLAEAAGTDLPDAARTLGNSLNQFQADASEASRFINVLAAGAKFGSSEIVETAEALRDSGTVAAAAGLSFEELNAAIQVLSSVAIKGSIAGTGLRNIILKLQNQADDGLNPAVVGLGKALENLAKQQLDTTELTKLFGLENVTAASALVRNAAQMADLTEKLTGTQTAYEQAAVKVDNFQGTLKQLDSVLESVFIKIGEKINPALREMTQNIINLINGFDDETKAARLFEEQLEANKTLVEAYGFSLQHIDKTNLEDVNRIIRAMTLNGVDLVKQAPFSKINDQILDTVFRIRDLQVGLEKVTSAYGADSVAAQTLTTVHEEQRKKLVELTEQYIKLDGAISKASQGTTAGKREEGPDFDNEAFIQALEESEEAIKKENEAYIEWLETLEDDSKKVFAATRTEYEKFSVDLEKLDVLLEANAITWDTYARAVFDAQEALDSSAAIDRSIEKSIEWADAWTSAGNRFASGIGDSVAEALIEQKNFGDAARAIARDALKQVISGLVEIGIKKAALFALEQSQIAATTATVTASNTAIAASAAPAAAGVSLATAGANSVPAAAGIAAVVALSAALIAGSRAYGGQVKGGKPYRVGELGSEIFVPETNGRIIPHSETSTKVTVNQNFVFGNSEPASVRQQIRSEASFIQRVAVNAVRRAMKERAFTPPF